MGFFLETLLGGLMAGMLYSLIALGFVLIFKASGVFNFAQGAMVLFAALAMARFAEWIPQWTGITSLWLANVAAFVLAVSTTGRCLSWLAVTSRPESGVSVPPKAMLSITPARRYSSSGRPLVRPLIGKLMRSVVGLSCAASMSLPVHLTAHRRPSGPGFIQAMSSPTVQIFQP